jgi:hypothetical protein
MAWHPHTDLPTDRQTAIIATRPPKDDADEPDCLLKSELYCWDAGLRLWFAENSGLLLRDAVFWWQPETDVLANLPA